MSIGKFSAVILFFAVCLNVNCSNVFSEKEVSYFRVQKLHEQIRSGDFRQIYAESSKNLRSRFTEDEFLRLMNEAAAKMKDVDEKLNFQESNLEKILPQLLNNENWASFKFEKLEKNGRRLEVSTYWSKGNQEDNFKLVSITIIESSETGKPATFII